MEARTPNFTLVLEEPLRRLAKNPTLVLAGLSNRYGLKAGDLQLWLDTFNGGKKELTADRIDRVKAEVGLITLGTAATAAPAAPHIEGQASHDRSARLPQERTQNGTRGPLLEACRILAENPGMAESAAAKKAGCSSWFYLKQREFGKGPIPREKLVAFLRDRGVQIQQPVAAEPSAEDNATPPAPAAVPKAERKPRAPRRRQVTTEVAATAGPPPRFQWRDRTASRSGATPTRGVGAHLLGCG